MNNFGLSCKMCEHYSGSLLSCPCHVFHLENYKIVDEMLFCADEISGKSQRNIVCTAKQSHIYTVSVNALIQLNCRFTTTDGADSLTLLTCCFSIYTAVLPVWPFHLSVVHPFFISQSRTCSPNFLHSSMSPNLDCIISQPCADTQQV